MGKKLKNHIAKYNDSLSSDQIEAKKVLENNIISSITGKFGTGKTHVAVTFALEQLAMRKYKTDISGIVITRPIVFEKERNLGFLPGTLWEKTQPYFESMLAIMKNLEGVEKIDGFVKDGTISIAPLMTVQGTTMTNKICLVDEAQNLTRQDVEDLYSRIGIGTRMVFMGDIKQNKLANPELSGFPRLCEIADLSDNIGYCELIENHRSPIVEEMLSLY